MSENLFFNILTFDVPSQPVTFHFSLEKIGYAQKLFKSKFPTNIEELFPNIKNENPEFIYTTFNFKKEGYQPLDIILSEQPKDLLKHYYNWRIKKYFKNEKKVVRTNFIQDNQIWLRDAKFHHKTLSRANKFTLKVQFQEVSDYGELIISYDGTAKIVKTPVSELTDQVSPRFFTGVLYNYNYYNYKRLPDDINDLSKVYPVLNNKLRTELNYAPDVISRKNKYVDYKAKINSFINQFLLTPQFKEIVAINNDDFLPVEKKRVGYVSDECNELVFNQGIGRIPKLDFKTLKPYARTPHKTVHLFFIYHYTHEKQVKQLHKYLVKGLDFFPGMEKYAGVLFHTEPGFSVTFADIYNPISEINDTLKARQFKPDVTYVAIYLSPISRSEQNLEKRDVYYKIKELLLYKRIVSQVIDFYRFKSNINNFVYDLTNISLAILAKLDGIPWQLNVANKKELVIGVGAFKNVYENIQYVASAFSFQNNGKFNEFHYTTKSNTIDLAGAISDAIYKFVNIEQDPDKVVIHFYKEMNDRELQPILKMMEALKLQCPLFILNINKTFSKDLIAFDTQWHGKLMPKSGTFINISNKEKNYLLFNNSRYNDQPGYPSAESYPFPIKIKITSPTPQALQDTKIIKSLLEQVYQFSRLYWKSLRQQNVPITIKYPEMVAEIAPNFEGKVIPPYGKDKLWFL